MILKVVIFMTLIVPTGFARRFYHFHCSNHYFLQTAGRFLTTQQGKIHLYRGYEKYCRWATLDRLWYPQGHIFQTPTGISGAFHRTQVGVTTMKAVITVAFWRVKHTEEVCLSVCMILGLPVSPAWSAWSESSGTLSSNEGKPVTANEHLQLS